MAPSTVFSYWRRDHRRPSSSSVPNSPLPAPTKNSPEIPPQLPGIPPTPTLADTIVESETNSPSPLNGKPPDVDTTKKKPDNTGTGTGIGTGTATGVSGSSTTTTTSRQSPTNNTTLRVPSPNSERPSRPHSSPEESKQVPVVITTQSNHSQQSFTLSSKDHSEPESSYKPSSPWKLTFGKGLLGSQSQSSDENKRSSTHGGITAGNMRLGSGGEAMPSPKEFKLDNVTSRKDDLTAEHMHQKSGKTKLHLLNPMSLLARRRSSHLSKSSSESLNIGAQNLVPALPDDYDPRIRGKIIHDFSAPRPRRNVSANRSASQDPNKQQANGAENGYHNNELHVPDNEQKKRRSEHSPVFQEHFGDDENVLQVENKGYLQSPLLTNPPPRSDGESPSLPTFAKNLPLRLPDGNDKPVKQTIETSEQPPAQPPLKHSSSKAQPQGAADNAAPQPSGLPRHLRSNASRFSFDMTGVGSSVQEKLLEEKHKEKEAARKAAKGELKKTDYSDSEYEDEFDDYDIDNDDDGLEERIPGVNVDADEDEFGNFTGQGKIAKGSLVAPALPTVMASPVSPVDPSSVTLHTPQDTQVQVVEPADGGSAKHEDANRTNIQNQEPIGMKPPASAGAGTGGNQSIDDGDFYFDDGDFGELPAEVAGERFDESIFDDETSDLYQRKVVVPVVPQAKTESNGTTHERNESMEESTEDQSIRHVPSLASDFQVQNCLPERMPSIGPPPKAQSGVLSEHNLEAFHSALEKVANEAAANGRFQRNTSVSEESIGQQSSSQTADSHPGMVSDDSRLSQTVDAMGFEDVFDDFNYDDDGFDDDPIIAEANAEALENDDEGFYGREFGFYAHAHGSCSSELSYGGYFGPRGIEGLTRSHSGRANFREPSLTPITERSEWSTRNSIISLTAHNAAHSNPSLSSPGLAQLVDMGSIDDEMSTLMKLRQDAWGGSNASAPRSSAGSPAPHPQQPSSNRASFPGVQEAHLNPADANSNLDSTSGLHVPNSPLRPSDEENSPASPILTSASQLDAGKSAMSDGDERSKVKAGTGRSHSRASSSASISYVKETDEDGSSKWVLERRRTGDSGEMEVYEREVLVQGRI
ncbi:hypothetical protein VTN00DRAFT_10307 [Thermoascus crustaceus]|uniref:uncharacterized protein n=1 Tax=Thermoascus crustaceus TaxID=5088 RepID=UPI0037434E61